MRINSVNNLSFYGRKNNSSKIKKVNEIKKTADEIKVQKGKDKPTAGKSEAEEPLTAHDIEMAEWNAGFIEDMCCSDWY